VLEPMSLAHVPALLRVGLDPELWRWIPAGVANEEEMRAYVEKALDEQRRGVSLPFVIVATPGEVVGSTRYGNIDLSHRRLEIGWTWVSASHQRTAVNTEAKLLLLTHAFERLGVHRVELKTDALNRKSRAAIARLGAVEEGIFRKHIVTASGRVRDTVYYSIIDTDWPTVKERLLSWLRR
jgi:N-acetyltransferase